MHKYIWGLVLITLGLSIFFPQFFNKEIYKYLLAAILILAGLKMIFSKNDCTPKSH